MLKSQTIIINALTFSNTFKMLKTPNFSIFNKYLKNFKTFSTKTQCNFNNTSSIIHQSYNPVTVLTIKDNKGARFQKTKLGRGPGSGKGKTSGRGHKGFKAHVGNPNRHYEGGQVPITRRLPKHGFRNNATKLRHSYINLDKIYYLIQKGRLNPQEPITSKHIFWAGGVSKIGDGVKILSRGSELLKEIPPLHLEISSASERAIDEIKKHGGTVTCVYKNRLTMRAQAKPWKFYKPLLDPVPRYKMVKKLLDLEQKGAIVKYNKPKWMITDHPRERELKFKTSLAKMKNAELLPEYPIKRVPHMNDDKIRQRRPFIWRKISFDSK